MHKRIRISLLLLLISVTLSTLCLPAHTSFGEQMTQSNQLPNNSDNNWDEETKQILQSSLSVVEIDKEIERLKVKLGHLEDELTRLDLELTEQELLLIEKREAAGKVLRSYFIGQRTDMFLSILNSKSLESFLKKLEFYELIIQHDQKVMTSYKQQQMDIELQYATYIAEQIKVEQAKLALEEKRAEVVKLEEDINSRLANRDDSDKILLLMEELTRQWNEEGIEKVEHYLYLLNEAMLEFPNWLQKQSEYTKIKGLTYNVQLPEQALNDFLREQDAAFEHFSFSFIEDHIVAKGKENHLEIELSGHYTIVNEPRHYIQFTIDSLYFNKLLLPQSTIDELMNKYDLNFYPALIVSFLQASEVKLSDGYLSIQLKLKI